MRTAVRIARADFDIAREWAACRERCAGAAGAVAAFAGLVRDHAPGSAVQGLYLEHYPGMTEASIERICMEAGNRWPLLDATVIHRVGELAPAEQIVLVLVAAAHRADAFAGCAFIMDYLKTDAVFWKKERRAAGDAWIEATAADRCRRGAWDAADAGDANG